MIFNYTFSYRISAITATASLSVEFLAPWWPEIFVAHIQTWKVPRSCSLADLHNFVITFSWKLSLNP
jgi:hypothetical protein